MQSDSEFARQLEQIRAGDAEALDSLLSSCRSIIRRHAHGMLGERHAARADTSDVVQETMTQAFVDIQKFRGHTRGEWMAWLRSILLARVGWLRRYHHAHKRSVLKESKDELASLPGPSPPPDAGLIEDDKRSELTLALEQLPAAMSEVIVRRVFLQQGFDEVGAAVGKSPGAVRVLWTRGVRKLRDVLPPDALAGDDPVPRE